MLAWFRVVSEICLCRFLGSLLYSFLPNIKQYLAKLNLCPKIHTFSSLLESNYTLNFFDFPTHQNKKLKKRRSLDSFDSIVDHLKLRNQINKHRDFSEDFEIFFSFSTEKNSSSTLKLCWKKHFIFIEIWSGIRKSRWMLKMITQNLKLIR